MHFSRQILLFGCIAILNVGCSSGTQKTWEMNVDGAILKVLYHSNGDLTSTNSTYTRAVVVVHSSDNNAKTTYDVVESVASVAGASETTLIVSPELREDTDFQYHSLHRFFPADFPTWTGSWRYGNLSNPVGKGPVRLSSFSVIDTILERLSDSNYFSSVADIIVMGHSAGGQFVNHYAAGSQAHNTVTATGRTMTYMISGPGGYLYLSDSRRVSDTDLNSFSVPTDCSGYDDYPAGLDSLNEYMATTTSATITAEYPDRTVYYIVGDQDTEELDDGCTGTLQGAHRYLRHRIYFNHLIDTFGSGVTANHQSIVASGVGHSGEGTLSSDCGRNLVFGDSSVSCTTRTTAYTE